MNHVIDFVNHAAVLGSIFHLNHMVHAPQPKTLNTSLMALQSAVGTSDKFHLDCLVAHVTCYPVSNVKM